MRITLLRTGGVTGLRKETSLDTDRLPPERAARLAECVDSCRFFDLPAPEGKGHPDRFQFFLTVDREGQERTISFHEGSEPKEIAPLLRELRTETEG
jgi:Emfourin